MPFELPPLPYDKDALAPHISAETIDFHYGKHHAGYVNKLNAAIDGTPMANKSLEELIRETAGDPSKAGIFNNAAQVWNHTFFWYSMKPGGGGEPTGAIASEINRSFGGYGSFKEVFSTAAATLFGSGWTWLVRDPSGSLQLVKTPNAENPLTGSQTPLLTLDVWEHAYYIDYRNARPKFIEVFLDNLVNWDFVNENLK